MISSEENEMGVDSPQQLRMLRLPQVCATTGLCRSTIYKLISEGRFPEPNTVDYTGGRVD